MSSVLNGNNKSIENEEPDSDINTYNSSQDEEQSKALENVSSDLKKILRKIPFSQTAQLVAKKKIQTAYLDIGKSISRT
jgi:outer membrane protein assembly factor BamD (BamD/ComL family)